MPAFSQEIFKYITTLVPYWRVCDEAWPLGEGDAQLIGIGVLRNYGGQVMLLPWNENTAQQLTRFREVLEPLSKRVVVLVDDRKPVALETISAQVTPIKVLPWSRRSELAAFVIKETSD